MIHSVPNNPLLQQPPPPPTSQRLHLHFHLCICIQENHLPLFFLPGDTLFITPLCCNIGRIYASKQMSGLLEVCIVWGNDCYISHCRKISRELNVSHDWRPIWTIWGFCLTIVWTVEFPYQLSLSLKLSVLLFTLLEKQGYFWIWKFNIQHVIFWRLHVKSFCNIGK